MEYKKVTPDENTTTSFDSRLPVYNGEDASIANFSPSPTTDDVSGLLKKKNVEKEAVVEPSRQQWDNKVQYILACVAFAVGLGNLWRFPFLCQKNGGGVFLVPYGIMLLIEGIPLFALELAIGQRLRKGPLHIWAEINPCLYGIGVSSFVVSFLCGCYYNTVVSWCLYYFFKSFKYPLPWSSCPSNNETVTPSCQSQGPTTYFWYRKTLEISPSIDATPGFVWHIALSILVAWIIVFLSMVKGIKSSGKVIYFTALFPYVVLIIFFFRGITLPHFYEGIIYMFKPDFSKLWDPEVWLEAATQIFFSLSLSFGGLIAMSSYMPIENNCYRDAIVVAIINCSTSLFAGIVVFSVLGHMAHTKYTACTESGLNETCVLEDFLKNTVSGTGMAFITFTEAINNFGTFSPLFSILFFSMLMSLGFGSMFGTLQGVLTSLSEMQMLSGIRREICTGMTCLISFVVAMIFATTSGEYILQIFDEFSATIPLLIIAFFECIAVAHVYGTKKFCDDIHMMCGERPNLFIVLCWKYISPIAMLIIFISYTFLLCQHGVSYTMYNPLAKDGVTEKALLPAWGHILAVCLTLTCTGSIPLFFVLRYFKLVAYEPEKPSYFPETELRAKFAVDEHEPNILERMII